MKRLILVLLALAAMPAAAALKVFATVPEWGALAQEIGGDQVQVFTATTALQDPHRIEARPSLIARARSADLLIATGADLEVGWLPAIQRESGNSRIQSGQGGYFEAARYVAMQDIPARLDRADGDVHAAGNPHIQTDPRNILKVGAALAQRMKELDPAQAAAYDSRWRAFSERWRASLARWEKAAAPLRGVAVVTQHKAWVYLFDWLGMREVATLEAKPGLESTLAHLSQVREQAAVSRPRMVIRAAYNSARPAEWLSAEAKLPIVVLPFTVGGTPQAKDLTSLFDDTLARLLAVK
ncbi:metal ABC transporter substrate-binding protein [Sulfuritalea sp.]|uniref:metal ABC transporter substrate-binding protein n=1 Tax=Sulfuritalea sp. TaxID=2480090 RepID=UPI00286D75C6|nr:zinc ABC transporter substrate-binding protein [Sulfuritalea sp.]